MEPDLTDEKIVVKLSEREWTVDVGQTAALQVTIVNGGELVSQFNIEAKGLDPDWVIFSSSEVSLNEGASETVSIFITPPRSPTSRAGMHVFSIVVTSPTYPGHRSRMGARLTIQPYYAFAIGELSPGRKTLSGFQESGLAEIEVRNQGNSEAVYRLEADDDQDACRFEFQVSDEDARLARQAQLVLSPKGDSEQNDGAATVGIVITPKSRRLVAFRSRTHCFAVTVSPTAGLDVPRSVMGQLAVKPLIGPGLLALLILLMAGLVLLVGWPRIREGGFRVEPRVVDGGEDVTLSWHVSRFVSDLRIEGSGLEEGAFSIPKGEETVFPKGPVVIYTLRVDNLLSRLIPISRAKSQEEELSVLVRPQAPVIHAFTADKQYVARGETVTIKWSVSHAERLILKAGDFLYDLSPDDQVGELGTVVGEDTLFSLEARSLGGADLSSVMVWHESPKIQEFHMEPSRIEAGQSVTLTWRVDGVDEVAISPFPGVYPAQDSLIDMPTQTTKYVLSALSGTEKVIATCQVIVTPK
jgi:hypothetical protein